MATNGHKDNYQGIVANVSQAFIDKLKWQIVNNISVAEYLQEFVDVFGRYIIFKIIYVKQLKGNIIILRVSNTDWIGFFLSYLHTKLRMISSSISGLATDSSCGVWGREWTTCLLCGGPMLGLCFKTIVRV